MNSGETGDRGDITPKRLPSLLRNTYKKKFRNFFDDTGSLRARCLENRRIYAAGTMVILVRLSD